MRIGIDCRSLEQKEGAGISHYTKNLVENLLRMDHENEYVLFFHSTPSVIPSEAEGRVEGSHKICFLNKGYSLPFVSSHILTAKKIHQQKVDIYHSPSGILPLFYNGPSIITVHDLSIISHPEWFPGFKFFLRKILIPQSIKKAKKIIVVSQYTKNQLKKLFNVPDEKIEMIYEGSSPARAGETGLPRHATGSSREGYFLFIGAIEPRKNLLRALQAFKKLNKEHPNIKFLLAGGRGWKNKDIFKKIEFLKPNVEYLGYVSEEEKYELLKGTLALVFVSLEEGFGLPVIEAMSYGAPVIVSNTSALKEISEGAAIQVDPQNPEEIYKAMKLVLEDRAVRESLSQKGFVRAQKFTWEQCGLKTLNLYKNLV